MNAGIQDPDGEIGISSRGIRGGGDGQFGVDSAVAALADSAEDASGRLRIPFGEFPADFFGVWTFASG